MLASSEIFKTLIGYGYQKSRVALLATASAARTAHLVDWSLKKIEYLSIFRVGYLLVVRI